MTAFEYRVTWRRGPHHYYSAHYATLAAAERKSLRVQGRIAESKGHDRDDFLCCDGTGGGWGCDCGGKTWGAWEDETTAYWTRLTALRIDRRPVGEWSVHDEIEYPA